MTSESTKRGSSCTFTNKKIIFNTLALQELEKSSYLQNGQHKASLLMQSSDAPVRLLANILVQNSYGPELNLALALTH